MIFGVFGRSNGNICEAQINGGAAIGEVIAKSGVVLLTGGCCGVPEVAAIAARKNGGCVVGVSPAMNQKEHIERYYQSKEIDINIYTGMGDTGRIPINVRSVDAAVFVGGGYGILAEFGCACADKKIIGVLTGIGGISDIIPDIIDKLGFAPKSKIFYSSNPQELINMLIDEVRKQYAQD